MDLVVDANILFAAIIRQSVTARLIVRDDLHLYAPEFLLEEFESYREEIIAKARNPAFDQPLKVFARRIVFVPQEEFASMLKEARRISPDPKDVPYLALALKMDIPLWTHDKALKEQQTRVKVLATADILKL